MNTKRSRVMQVIKRWRPWQRALLLVLIAFIGLALICALLISFWFLSYFIVIHTGSYGYEYDFLAHLGVFSLLIILAVAPFVLLHDKLKARRKKTRSLSAPHKPNQTACPPCEVYNIPGTRRNINS